MRSVRRLIAMAAFAAAALPGISLAQTNPQALDRKCDNQVLKQLEKARKYRGPDFHKFYKAFLDDGKGGVAKRLRKSSTRYSAQECRDAYDKKVRELRGGARINR